MARNLNLSVTTVIRLFDQYVENHRTKLPKIKCFDEVYSSRKSYQNILFLW